jgi:hypothetical protein
MQLAPTTPSLGYLHAGRVKEPCRDATARPAEAVLVAISLAATLGMNMTPVSDRRADTFPTCRSDRPVGNETEVKGMRYLALLALLALLGCAQQQRDLPSSSIASSGAAQHQ